MKNLSRKHLGHPDSLHNGDCLTQRDFHRYYEKMPEGFRAELIGGTVFVSEPLGMSHSNFHLRLGSVFDAYRAATPGLEAGDNATVILSEDDEVQPDLFLRILPEYKGQSGRTGKGPYIKGAPELVAEISYSSRSIDLHLKRKRYLQTGVIEYLVVCLDPQEIHWLDLRNQRKVEAGPDGVFRSSAFAGLWVDADALFQLDYRKLMDVLSEGLSSQEHSAFVEKLAAARS